MNGYVAWGILLIGVVGYLYWKKNKARRRAHKSGWYAGPTVNGKAYSSNVASQPTLGPEGLYIDLPVGKGSLNYLQCFDLSSMRNVREMRLRFRVDADEDVRFIAQDAEASPIASLGLMIQRRGDRHDDKYESYRWFSNAEVVLAPGEFEIVVPVNTLNMAGMNGGKDPQLLLAALADVDNYGIVFGSAGGRGHGVFVSGPARFTILDFNIS